MFNLIQMDLYRLTHSVSTWVILAFTIFLAVFCVSSAQSDLRSKEADPAYAQEAPTKITRNEERQIGIVLESDPDWIGGRIEAGSLISTEIKSSLLVLLCIILTALFVNSETKNGYIKNIAGQFPNRGILILSKLIVLAVCVCLMMLIFSAVTAAAGFLFWGRRFYMGSLAPLAAFLAVQYLLHLGFSAFILFLSILTRSSAFTMVFGLLTSCGVLVPLYSFLNRIIRSVRPGTGFDISRYMLDGNINMTGINTALEGMIRAVFVGILFILVCTALSMAVMTKRDIR